MPNTGKPSQDCHLCRRRRVKCDLTRPSCNRCIKYGAECPGYRTQQELVFRNATPATTKKKKKRTSPPSDESETAASPADDTSGSATPSTVGDLVRAIPKRSDEFPPLWTEHTSAVHVPLARSLNQHWTQHSVPILLNVYSALDFLHNTYRVYDRNGPLLWAAHLFSRTYVTNLRNPTAIRNDSSDETDKMLGMYMGKTLKAVSQALSKPDGAFRDDVLATVWILANYEILVGSLGVEPMSPWHLHTKGMYTMLQMRGVESIKTDKGRTAFWPVYNMIQIQSLMANIEAPAESDEWLRTIEEHMFPGEALTLYIAVFITKVCKFQAQAIKYIRSRDFAGMSAYYRQGWQLMTSAENELKEWIDSQPPFEHELDPYMRNMQYSAIVKGYHIMQMMCNMLTHYPPCPIPVEEVLTHRRFCLQTLRIASQGILSNIPYAIGPLARGKDKSPRVLFDALKLIWPLLCVYMVSTTTQEQKKTAWTTLRFIGDEVGVKQATKAHENMVLLPPEALEPLVLDGADVQWVASPEVDVAFMGMI